LLGVIVRETPCLVVYVRGLAFGTGTIGISKL